MLCRGGSFRACFYKENSFLILVLISSSKDLLMCKVDFVGISLSRLRTCNGSICRRRIDLIRIPIVPWTLNRIWVATSRAEASSADLVNAHLKDAIFLDMRKHMMKKNCKKLQSKGQIHQFFTVFDVQFLS